MKGQNFASQVLSRHTLRISRKKGSDFFDHRGTLSHNQSSVVFSSSDFRPRREVPGMSSSVSNIAFEELLCEPLKEDAILQ